MSSAGATAPVPALFTALSEPLVAMSPAPLPLLRYIVEKGSVAVDGISLTVASVDGAGFSVALIPHSFANTTLQFAKEGSTVNIENDVIGKYVEKFMQVQCANRNEK